MAGRQLYGQPAPQPPAPMAASKPAPPAHSPYGAPASYGATSGGFDEQSFNIGGGRYSETNKGAPQAATQTQQTPQPIGAAYNTQQQGLHNFLGGAASSAASQPNRPQAGTPDDNFKQTAASATGARAQPAQPQTQAQGQAGFNSYPYGQGYQNQDWSQYGQQQQQQYGSRNGYQGWQQ